MVKTLTATHVSRHFVVITRAGRELAILTPVPAANGDAVTAALNGLPDDDAYWDAVEAAREEVSRSWPVG